MPSIFRLISSNAGLLMNHWNSFSSLCWLNNFYCFFQCVIDSGALTAFQVLLRHPKANIQKEALWALSNITAGNPTQIQAIIDAGVMPLIIEILAKVKLVFAFMHS